MLKSANLALQDFLQPLPQYVDGENNFLLALGLQKGFYMSSSSFEPVFIQHFQFDLADAKNFLNPSIYFVGAMWEGGEEEKIHDFIDRGIWVNRHFPYDPCLTSYP